jgi:hypothetical protein
MWRLLTGEYPPQKGGVSDYSRQIANGLAASGDMVHIYAPPFSGDESSDDGVRVHRLRGHFDLLSLRELGRELHNFRDDPVLVEYVPHAFGFKAMNLPFCLWLYALSRTHRRILVMFHEATFPMQRGQPLRHKALALVTSLMAMLVARAASTIFVSTPAWKGRLIRFIPKKKMEWLPVPSNVAVANEQAAVEAARRQLKARTIVGHFGTCDGAITYSLSCTLPRLIETSSDVSIMLIGRDGTALSQSMNRSWPRLANRIYSTGELCEKDVSIALSSCDIMVQPYADGVTTRRTSLMAGLAHQRPIVTSAGVLTESIWSQASAVALAPAGDDNALYRELSRLVDNVDERSRIASAGKRLYDERFALCHTIRALNAATCR